MFYKVKNVHPLPNLMLLVDFENGVQKQYSIESLLSKWKTFTVLKDNEKLFNSVKVDGKGYGISWNDDLDLSCSELFENGIEITNTEKVS